VPFDLFDPFGLSKNASPEKKAKGLITEINNGSTGEIEGRWRGDGGGGGEVEGRWRGDVGLITEINNGEG